MLKRLFFFICCIGAVILGLYHANKFFFLTDGNIAGHLIFVCICAVSAYGFLKRPIWFLYFFAVIMVQQLYSSAKFLYNQWVAEHLFDLKSFLVIIAMPIIFMALQKDKQHASKAS